MGGLIKYFRFTWDEVLWEMSYTNLMMLSATIPKHKPEKGDKKAKGKAASKTDDSFSKAFNNFFKK